MKLKKVNILGESIDIRLISEEELHRLIDTRADEHEVYGAFLPGHRTIYINKSLEPEQIGRTLIHEVVHAHLSICGLSSLLEENMEEAVCVALEGFYNLVQSKEFVHEITGG
jgi:Zn-dependent peptidase ImmA (M78 family)